MTYYYIELIKMTWPDLLPDRAAHITEDNWPWHCDVFHQYG